MMKNLKKARKTLGLTQKQMSEVAQTPLRTYQKWEQGEVPTPGAMRVLITLLLKYKGAIKYLFAKQFKKQNTEGKK